MPRCPARPSATATSHRLKRPARASPSTKRLRPRFVKCSPSSWSSATRWPGIRIDPLQLSRLTHRRVIGLYQQGSPVAYWYLAFKNLAVQNDLKSLRGAIFFFRDDQSDHPGAGDARIARSRREGSGTGVGPDLGRRSARCILGCASGGARGVSVRSNAPVARAAGDALASAAMSAGN